MKNFLSGSIIIIFLLFFVLQTALEIRNEYRINKFSQVVYVATQKARMQGRFTDEIISEIKSQLMSAFPDLSEADIHIDVTTTPKYRLNYFDMREAINYNISIPIRKIIVAPGLFGISDAQNQYRYGKTGFVLSEVLP